VQKTTTTVQKTTTTVQKTTATAGCHQILVVAMVVAAVTGREAAQEIVVQCASNF
jgi:hypothetical protein